MREDTVRNELFIHYGTAVFDPTRFKEVKNRSEFIVNKPIPHTGFWATLYQSPDMNSWKDWCEGNNFYTEKLKDFFTFFLKEDAKILEIQTQNDVDKFVRSKYQQKPVGYERRFYYKDQEYPDAHPDFEMLSKDFDAMYVKEFGNVNSGTHWQFYGWDCDSLLIFNPQIIVKVGDSLAQSC